MKRNEFEHLFKTILEQAVKDAETRLGVNLTRDFIIEMHGAGHPGTNLNLDAALDNLYLDEDQFYRIVDVAIIQADVHSTKVFVRISGHNPTSFEHTWNTPKRNGLFKILISSIDFGTE